MITWRNILFGVVIIAFDLIVYIVLGLLLMGYDDFYDESKGAYWSLASMTAAQKKVYIGLQVWHSVNIICVLYIIYRVVKRGVAWPSN
jgi:hypothetical protein